MFMDPSPSPFDLRFRLFGIPIRVHPSFWLFSAIFGWGYFQQWGFPYLLLWIGCMFLSILVHELGHVVMGILCGQRGHIVLYSFGGLAIGNYQHAQRWQRIAIALAGPAAGFLLLGLVVLLDTYAVERLDPAANNHLLRRALRVPTGALEHPGMLFFMNLFWNVLNLLPVYPLDGGQVMREVCTGASPRQGLQVSLGLSVVLAGLIAVYSVVCVSRKDLPYPPLDPIFSAILFGLLALQSFQAMQALERERRRWEQDQDPW